MTSFSFVPILQHHQYTDFRNRRVTLTLYQTARQQVRELDF